MSKGAFFIRRRGAEEPRDATSPLEGYEYIGVVDGEMSFTTAGVDATGETFSADAPMSFGGSLTMTATVDGMDEDMMRKLLGWTVLCVEDPDTRYKTFHRVYTWDYKKMERGGSYECLVHRPTLILPPDIPDAERVIDAWLEMDEVPGEDYAYVRKDEPDVLRTMSIIDYASGIGMYWMMHDL